MKRRFLRKWQFPTMIAAGTMPLPLLLSANLTPERPLQPLVLTAAYWVLAMLLMRVPGRRRVAAGVVCALALVAAGFAMPGWMGAPAMLLVPVFYAVLLIMSLTMGGLGEQEELSPLWGTAGVIIHVLAQLLMLVDDRTGGLVYGHVSAAIKTGFVCYAVLAVLSMNRISLVDAAAKGNSAPTPIRRKNLLLTLGLLALVFLIACLPAVIRAAQRLWMLVVQAVMWVLYWLNRLMNREAAEGGMGGSPELGAMAAEQQDPSLLAIILEKIAVVLGLILVAVLLFFALRKLWRILREVLAELMKRLSAFAAAASEDYEDEISDTREAGEHAWQLFRFRRRSDPLKGVDEMKLLPRERIRFHYLKLLYRHSSWQPSRTARENLPADAAELYERARYSDHDLSGQEAEAFAQKVRKL